MTPPAPKCRLGWLAAVLFSFTGCGANPSVPENPTISSDAPVEAAWRPDDSSRQPSGYRPVETLSGDFEGRLVLETPVGGALQVAVQARARKADTQAGNWDLYFFDTSRTLSPSGVISLRGGAGKWLSQETESHVLQMGLVSLPEGAIGTPGASVLRHDRTGDLRGELWLRMPTAGADLPPVRARFWLNPTSAAADACEPESDIGRCFVGTTCDVRSGFCLKDGATFAPGYFSGGVELVSYHKTLSDWGFGPQLPSDVSFSAVWCASEQVGLRGQWTDPSMGSEVSPLLPLSGDVACVDPLQPHRDLSVHGPAPLLDSLPAGNIDAGMRSICINELLRTPSPQMLYVEGGMDFANYGGGFLDYKADCISLGHFAALYESARFRAYDNASDGAGVHARKIVQRLLQQWLQVHRFILSGDMTRAETLQALQQMDAGWAFVMGAIGHSGIDFLLDVDVPDYRRDLKFGYCGDSGTCMDPSLRCETAEEACSGEGDAKLCVARRCVLDVSRRNQGELQPDGAVPLLLDTLADHLRLASRTVDAETLGETVRLGLLIESLVNRLHSRASLESQPSWASAYQASVARYRTERERALATLGLVRNGVGRKVETGRVFAARP